MGDGKIELSLQEPLDRVHNLMHRIRSAVGDPVDLSARLFDQLREQQSVWREEGRLLGRTELSPVEGALARCQAWAPLLKSADVGRILHAPDELSSLTAGALAKTLGIRTKDLDELIEVDTGLWTGLAPEQLETRYETAFHELLELDWLRMLQHWRRARVGRSPPT